MARVVNLLGAEIGDNLLPAVPNNPKGFWEHYEILELHRRLLTEIRSFWDDIRPLPKEWYREPAVEKISSEIVEIIQRDFGQSKLWVLKEPRMCRLLKLWHPIFSELNCRAHFIFIFRHPLEVAASLSERNNLPLNKSLQFWLEYVLEAEQETRNYPRVFVSFQALIDDWKATLARISSELQLEWPVSFSEVETEIDGFLELSLKHHTCSEAAFKNEFRMPEHIVKVFNELTAAQNGETGTIVETFSEISESLRNDFERFLPTALIEEVQVRLAQVDELRNDLKRNMQILYRTNKSLQAVLDSKSWRLTAPLRRVYDLLTRNKK
jgi:hypothetical protein